MADVSAPVDDAVEGEIRAFLRESLPRSAPSLADLPRDAPLWEAVDSLSVLELVEYIEKRFALKVPALDFIPENFATIGRITRYLKRRREA